MALHLNVNQKNPSDQPLVLAAEVIQAGGVIVYPTETIYGIGANAWNSAAVSRVQKIKHRSDPKPILVVVDSAEAAAGVTAEIPRMARPFMDRFWPGPLTLVMKASLLLPEALTLGRGTIGVRIPSNPVCLRLLALCGCPLTSTSANLSGEKTASAPEEIERHLGQGIDLYLNAGVLPEAIPSTVLDVTGDRPKLIREGAIRFHQLTDLYPSIER